MDAGFLRGFGPRMLIAVLMLMAFFQAPAQAQDASAPTGSTHELIMVRQNGCYECQAWERLLGPIYPQTSEGQFAPLRMVDLRADLPADLEFKYRPRITPTFILVENGKELGRIEGNPGDEFFWIYLDRLLADHTGYKADAS